MSPESGRRAAWGGLGSLGSFWQALLGHEPRRVRLPIAFLPGRVGMLLRGQPALLLLGDAVTRQRALRVLLETELHEAPVTWLGADEAEVRALGPQVEAAARSGRLRALAWTPGAAAALRQRGEAYLMQELGTCGLRRRELLVVDLLAPWLQGLAPEADAGTAVQQATAALQRWSRMHAAAPVLALAPLRHGAQALLPLFERTDLPCLAQLQRHGQQVHLEVTRWPESRTGTMQDIGFGLVERADGGWQADGSGLALDTHALATASDAERVITLADALAGAGGPPAGWQVCATLAELVAACRYAVAATVLLPYRGVDELPALVDTVRHLRAAHPHALKIVVREVGGQLRYNQELALVRLGANTVIYRNVGFSRLLQTLVELRNQTYSRRVSAQETREMLRAVEPEPVRGYLPLPAFCEAAERMLDRTEPVEMANCIVQLPLLPQVAHIDALSACHMSRDGDIVTADAQALWLFLFACRAPDVEATLQRLFTLPLSDLFAQMGVRPEPDSMRRALEKLRRHSVDAVTDYSDVLLSLQPPRLEVADSGFVMLHPPGQDTLPAPLDEPEAAPAPASAPEPFLLKLRP